MQNVYAQKLKVLETQILDLKKNQESQVHILKEKQKSDEAAKRLKNEIQCIKTQKVQLQHKIKQVAEQVQQWKASREKEFLQLRKEGRRNEHVRHKLQALNQCQKMVLQRKTEEAAVATKRLKELLEVRRSTTRSDRLAHSIGHTPTQQSNEKSLRRWLDHELEVAVNTRAVRFEYEKQSQVRASLADELASLKQEDQFSLYELSLPRGNNGNSRVSSMSPNARSARIASLEGTLSTCSNALVAMASQLAAAEEQERGSTACGRWNLLRSMGDGKNLLQYMFTVVTDARCRLWEKEIEIMEMKEQVNELVNGLQQTEAHKKEIVKEQKLREQAVAIALATSSLGKSPCSLEHFADDTSGPSSPRALPAPKQLKYTAGIANGSAKESTAFLDRTQRKLPAVGHGGKLWRWKRSHHQWLLQFKWKWQKPWKLAEWIKHCDETIVRPRPCP